MSRKHAVAIVINAAFVKYAKALLNSMAANWPGHPEILLFVSEALSAEDEAHFRAVPRLSLRLFNPQDYEYRQHLRTTGAGFSTAGFNDAGYFIVNFWSPAFDEYENILVLDADMLVLKPLDALLDQREFFAVSAANPRRFPLFDLKRPGLAGKAIEFAQIYAKALAQGIVVRPRQSINSGVLLIPRQWRSPPHYARMLQLLRDFYPHCPSDQEIIYLWMLKNDLAASEDFRMNFQARFLNGLAEHSLPATLTPPIAAAAGDIHILHFNGPKPDSKQFRTHAWTKGREELAALYSRHAAPTAASTGSP